MSAFEIFMRTGRRVLHELEVPEVKFNPWHDPDNGRFTFAGRGRHYGGGHTQSNSGAPRRPSLEKPARPASIAPSRPPSAHRAATAVRPSQSTSKPVPGPNQDSPTYVGNLRQAVGTINREMGTIQPTLRSIPGYPDAGKSSWRGANDRAFIDAANRFNSQRGLKPGDPKYVDPLLIKAWAMVESGGSQSAFLTDPLQVNNPGDYKKPKPQVTGLAKGQRMSPATSIEAALKWLEYRGYYRDEAGKPGPWIGFEEALQRYNGRSDLHPSGVPHKVWYARQVLKLYREGKKAK